MQTLNLTRDIPEWAEAHLEPKRFHGARGGRASGKSHFFAEYVVEQLVLRPSLRVLCIREVQRSLKFSAKHLIEKKIEALGVESLFVIRRDEIQRVGGDGLIAFTGMQDHTADSIKSFEDFGIAWFEEAQRMSQRSLSILVPTIRMPGSQVMFTWNPDMEDDPVERFFQSMKDSQDDDFVLTDCNYLDNPWCPAEAAREARRLQATDPDSYEHVWMGGFNKRSEAQVLAGKWRVDEFEPGQDWDGPYFGADWGFANDPTVLIRFWIAPGRHGGTRLMIEHEMFAYNVDLLDLPDYFDRVPGAREHVIRGDPSRPETISHLRRAGFRTQAAPSWQSKTRKGPVQDGIAWLRKHEEIVIHRRCTHIADEAKSWCYTVDRITGDPLPKLAPGNDHGWDSVRYGASPMIKQSAALFAFA